MAEASDALVHQGAHAVTDPRRGSLADARNGREGRQAHLAVSLGGVRHTVDLFNYGADAHVGGADLLCDCNRSKSRRTTIVRWLPPKGGGADTPGRVAKSGHTRLSAMSCISAGTRVGRLNTSCPMGTLPASTRVMKGGTAPGGMKAPARFT